MWRELKWNVPNWDVQVLPVGLGCIFKTNWISHVLRRHPMTCTWSTGSGKWTGHGATKKNNPTPPWMNGQVSATLREWRNLGKKLWWISPSDATYKPNKKPLSGTMNGATRWRAGRPSGASCGRLPFKCGRVDCHQPQTDSYKPIRRISGYWQTKSFKFGANFVRDLFRDNILTWVQFESEVLCFTERHKIFLAFRWVNFF
jgi:hypothetical protein